jgi:RHS repeat-associated protein
LPDGGVRLYIYASDLALVPLLFVDYTSIDAGPENGTVSYVVTNHLGAAELVLNDSVGSVWSAQLDPYGLAHIEKGKQFHQPLRFPGHFFDAETGLHYNRFRYYDPTLARYLESDPIGIDGGVNLYAYTSNPLREVDVRGLAPKCPNGKDCPRKKRAEGEGNDSVEGTDVAGRGPNAGKSNSKAGAVSHEERRLAGDHGSRPEQIAARKRVADDFIKQYGKKWDPKQGKMRPHTDAERSSELKGIDFSKPVRTRPPDSGEGRLPALSSPQYCVQAPGRRNGQYYSGDPKVEPGKLGIGRYGSTSTGGAEKVRTPCAVTSDTPYMQSTAAPVKDTWSGTGVFAKQDAPGGATQHYVPDNSVMQPGPSQPL